MKCNFFKTTAILLGLITINSCSNDLDINEENLVDEDKISIAVINKLKEINLNSDYIKKVSFETIDGNIEDLYEIEGDVTISHEELMKIGTTQNKQYSTYNLVSNPSSIRVVGYTGGAYALSQTAKTALQYAVNNFNNLNSNINMQLVFGTQFYDSDIVVYRSYDVPADNIRGRANFPRHNGLPGHWVRINQGANNSNDAQIIEGLMTHEIGHAIGLRHTDWNTRQSCGETGETSGSEGAVYIPGTAGASNDNNSIMNACFPSHVQGELSYYDRIALEYLY